MKWSSAREKLLKLASERRVPFHPLADAQGGEPPRARAPVAGSARRTRRRGRADVAAVGEEQAAAAAEPSGVRREPRASSLCVASGKGGTGKSVVTASLATLFARTGRTLLADVDLGVGNAHILQDVAPAASLVDVVEGERSLREVLVPCAEQVDLLACGSGVPRMAGLSGLELQMIGLGLEELEADYRYVIFDSAAGVSRQTLAFAAASDLVLIVTTPDLTAMTDAYAFLKVLRARAPRSVPLLLVNRAADEAAALEVAERIDRVGRRFLACGPRYVGWLPEDPAVSRCVNRRSPVVVREPDSPFGSALHGLAATLLEALGRQPRRGAGARLRAES